MTSANTDKMGSMNIGNLGTFLRGYFEKNRTVYEMGVQKMGFLGGVPNQDS
jgi:hypothetical protein